MYESSNFDLTVVLDEEMAQRLKDHDQMTDFDLTHNWVLKHREQVPRLTLYEAIAPDHPDVDRARRDSHRILQMWRALHPFSSFVLVPCLAEDLQPPYDIPYLPADPGLASRNPVIHIVADTIDVALYGFPNTSLPVHLYIGNAIHRHSDLPSRSRTTRPKVINEEMQCGDRITVVHGGPSGSFGCYLYGGLPDAATQELPSVAIRTFGLTCGHVVGGVVVGQNTPYPIYSPPTADLSAGLSDVLPVEATIESDLAYLQHTFEALSGESVTCQRIIKNLADSITRIRGTQLLLNHPDLLKVGVLSAWEDSYIAAQDNATVLDSPLPTSTSMDRPPRPTTIILAPIGSTFIPIPPSASLPTHRVHRHERISDWGLFEVQYCMGQNPVSSRSRMWAGHGIEMREGMKVKKLCGSSLAGRVNGLQGTGYLKGYVTEEFVIFPQHTTQLFAAPGDSGLVIVSDEAGENQGQPVALLFGGNAAESYGFCTPIRRVIERIQDVTGMMLSLRPPPSLPPQDADIELFKNLTPEEVSMLDHKTLQAAAFSFIKDRTGLYLSGTGVVERVTSLDTP